MTRDRVRNISRFISFLLFHFSTSIFLASLLTVKLGAYCLSNRLERERVRDREIYD